MNFLKGLHLAAQNGQRYLFHAQHQFSQAGAHDFVPVLPQFMEQASSIGRVEFNVFSQIGTRFRRTMGSGWSAS